MTDSHMPRAIGRRVFTEDNPTDAINEWIAQESIEVINIETVRATRGGHMESVKSYTKMTVVWYWAKT